jgi:hypothetical protein
MTGQHLGPDSVRYKLRVGTVHQPTGWAMRQAEMIVLPISSFSTAHLARLWAVSVSSWTIAMTRPAGKSDQIIALSPSVPAKVIGGENWTYRMTGGSR